MAENDELLDHDYDGIQEYDNDLPRWWMGLFALTILYGCFYLFYYQLGPGLLSREQLAADMQKLEEIRAASEAAKPKTEMSEEILLAMVTDTEAIKLGAEVFAGKCAACHSALGEGLVGPNLTDEYWIHGGNLMNIRSIVINGVTEKGMVPWKGILSDDEINQVTIFVRSLRGTNPANAKGPEGELFTQ